jgi:hypothetical protein
MVMLRPDEKSKPEKTHLSLLDVDSIQLLEMSQSASPW